jgi:hypothetical protein
MKDSLGNPMSGADATSLAAFEQGVHELQCYVGDPVASVRAALERSPGFVMAHALQGYLHLLGTDPGPVRVARAAYDAAKNLPADARERGHLGAVRLLADGRWLEAGRVLEDVAIDHPRDALALQVGHLIDFYTGQSRMLRDRIARALPAWREGMPGYHAVIGMHAFGLEETGDYARAEAAGRKGIDLEPRDGWSQHAVAHVMEMQGRHKDGIAWMRADTDAWSRDSFFCIHNWWHLALYHLDLGEIGEVMALFDGPIYGSRSKNALDMVDASALLWRLHLRGAPVGERWQLVADNWAPIANAGNYAFNDAHAMMAFVGAGRGRDAASLLEAQDAAMRGDGDNATFTREVGNPLCRAIKAFGDGDYRETVRILRPLRATANRFGGSHAQRDLLDLTLIEAALRSGGKALAAALAAERIAAKPTSPLARLFVERADAMEPAT